MAKKKGGKKKGNSPKKAATANKSADTKPAADDAVPVAASTEEVAVEEGASPVSADEETTPAPEVKVDGGDEAEKCVDPGPSNMSHGISGSRENLTFSF